MKSVEELLKLAISIAKEAGALLLLRPAQLSVDTKTSDIDIVTQMDKQSEKLIVDAILKARPDDGIIGEEGASRPSKSGYTWVIDPIDGTVNYFYNMHGWSVSIAIRDPEGIAVGVVYAPTINSLYTATRGGGAYLNGVAIHANEPVELNKALIATGFHYRSDLREIQVKQFNDLILKVRDIRRNGSAAIDICHVAAGLVDGYYEMGLYPWDRDAAELIANEAGAKVSVHGELTIAAGPHLHRILSAQLLS
ncbi:MAG: inositol monophosphatase family protein [Candidatus Nanopelagicaceae bacterium]